MVGEKASGSSPGWNQGLQRGCVGQGIRTVVGMQARWSGSVALPRSFLPSWEGCPQVVGNELGRWGNHNREQLKKECAWEEQ